MGYEIKNYLNSMTKLGVEASRSVATFVKDLKRSTATDAAKKIAVVTGDASAFAALAAIASSPTAGFLADGLLPMSIGFFSAGLMRRKVTKDMYRFAGPRPFFSIVAVAGLVLGSPATTSVVSGIFLFNRLCNVDWIIHKP